MNKIQFRDATEADLPVIVDIYNSTIAGRMVTADTERVTVADRLKWFSEHSKEKRPLWIVSNQQQQIIGWVSFQNFYGRPAYDGTAEISIYLDETRRGKGFGKAILETAMQECASLQIHTLLGFIFAHNETSLRLFQHAGFAEWADLKNIALLDEKEYSLKILGKRINP